LSIALCVSGLLLIANGISMIIIGKFEIKRKQQLINDLNKLK